MKRESVVPLFIGQILTDGGEVEGDHVDMGRAKPGCGAAHKLGLRSVDAAEFDNVQKAEQNDEACDDVNSGHGIL